MLTEQETERRVDMALLSQKINSTEINVQKLVSYFEGPNNIHTKIKLNGRIAKTALTGVGIAFSAIGLIFICLIGDIKLINLIIKIFG